MLRLPRLACLLLAPVAACGAVPDSTDRADAARPAMAATKEPFVKARVAAFANPWAMAFLPDGAMLVTEKAGTMRLVSPDLRTIRTVAGTPNVDSAGQGALMDIVPAPDFARNRRIYLSWSAAGAGGKGVVLGTALLSTVDAPRLDDLKVIFRAAPLVAGDGHYSGRIAFSPDGRYLFFTAGERQKFTPAQDPQAMLGKVLRLNLDGTPAAGNPLAAKGFDPAVWSYGHRNLLGLAFDKDGRLWEQEMGPKGGDEINLIEPGRNYGWPHASNGNHYDGRDIPDHKAGDGYAAPKTWWNPSISPAGLLYYTGDLFPQWKGSLFLGGLSGQALIRVALDGDTARKADQWDLGTRIRDVEQGPDGALWVLEDGDPGRLWKLTPSR